MHRKCIILKGGEDDTASEVVRIKVVGDLNFIIFSNGISIAHLLESSPSPCSLCTARPLSKHKKALYRSKVQYVVESCVLLTKNNSFAVAIQR